MEVLYIKEFSCFKVQVVTGLSIKNSSILIFISGKLFLITFLFVTVNSKLIRLLVYLYKEHETLLIFSELLDN